MNACVSVIIAAAGESRRMGVPKQSIELLGKPLLAHTMLAFNAAHSVAEIVAVARAEDSAFVEEIAARYGIGKLAGVVSGGATRQQSVTNGLAKCGNYPLVAIQDGARPLITPEAIDAVAAEAARVGGAAAAVPAVDTLKTADAEGNITGTPDRRVIWQVQTPQIFSRKHYEKALTTANAAGGDFTDDCQLMERAGHTVRLVNVGVPNFKVTVPSDVVLAQAVLTERSKKTMRIGHGYDVHKLVAGRPLILGGVTIPHETGLLGHSDADVLTHAIMDALLGAAALGDIGGLFPDTDPAYAGADSIELLRCVIKRVEEAGYRVVNIDATVLAQAPKLKPHIKKMREIVATACGLSVDCVNIKATTEEGLGFTGAKEGMAAHAVCLLA